MKGRWAPDSREIHVAGADGRENPVDFLDIARDAPRAARGLERGKLLKVGALEDSADVSGGRLDVDRLDDVGNNKRGPRRRLLR